MLPFSIGHTLVASLILGAIGLYAAIMSTSGAPEATMRISPERKVITPEETLTITVDVESLIPVNAFSGTLVFDPTVFSVLEIQYNTSLADLWVEEPWFSTGEGTITFAGGTTKSGGFSGQGTLLTIIFTPLRETNSILALSDAHIYEHDGFGSEAVIGDSVDALFTIASLAEQARPAAALETSALAVTVIPDRVSFDLNSDGKITFTDVSIFMLHIFENDTRYDFNQDGQIDRADLNLLLAARD